MSQQKLNRPWYIIIEGAIGVGKTTLARLMRDRWAAGLLLEVFEENPFLADFYRARDLYAFQTQMFFLLSRYRQQQQLPQLIQQGALISDYMFAKDRLFAKLNLKGDEWDVYEQLHQALAEQIPKADLIVYLQADTDVLMGRIAQRDRPYERDMDRQYIEAVRQMYDDYFYSLQETTGLIIDTNELNFVTRPADLQYVLDKAASVLKEGTFQQPLPQLEVRDSERDLWAEKGRKMADYQKLHVELDRNKGFKTNVYFNYLCLSEEMGELGSELAKLWKTQDLWAEKGESGDDSLEVALRERREAIESELADCLAYLMKLANYTGIDLESAYLNKMNENKTRTWS